MRLPPPAPWRSIGDITKDIVKKILAAQKRKEAANDA